MDFPTFKQILQSFIDSPDQLTNENGDFAVQLGAELLSGHLETRAGTLYVQEGDKRTTAEQWIINRVAMLPALADRILLSTKQQQAFVTPRAQFLPSINTALDDQLIESPNAIATIGDYLDRRPGGTSSVLYLTSDAGEGKTTSIGELARLQAEKFKRKETDWLLVPINLGGKPFLRFDDVVAAALMNQLRFQRLYFDSFMYLVRMGVIVPALDGFEEIFIENSEGDAISSLGSLIHQLRGEGALLIAARKAYFEFQSLSNQAKLLDSLRGSDVSFARVGLRRWERDEFIQYAMEMAMTADEAIALYQKVVSILTAQHPLVTRPVLVRRLIEVIEQKGLEVLDDIRPRASGYFAWLVSGLLDREANEKWLDKHGNPPSPLLSILQHHELLSYIAEEMWTSKTSILNGDMLESLAELYCESAGLSPVVARQVRERVKQHAFIVAAGVGSRDFMFDHENFRDYFLGEQLSRHMLAGNDDDIRRVFRADLLPTFVQETSLELITKSASKSPEEMIKLVLRVALSEGTSSFVRENGGLLLSGLLSCERKEPVQISNIVFPPDSLRGWILTGVKFSDCYFRPTSVSSTRFVDCVFDRCEFEEISIPYGPPVVERSELLEPHVHCIRVGMDDEEAEHYDPQDLLRLLTEWGFKGGVEQIPLVMGAQPEIEDDLRIVRKVIQAFYRSTTIFENVFRRRLSLDASRFFNFLLPQLERSGIIEEISITAATKYRLGVPLSVLSKAVSECDGRFQCFLDKVEELK